MKATKAAYAAGYRKMDAYSPFPIEEASEALGFHKTRVPLIVLVGALLGGSGAYGLQYWINVHLLSAEHRRPSLAFVAGIHRADVRDDGLVWWTGGRVRHVRAEWTAHAASSGV